MKTQETTQEGGEAALIEQINTLQKQLDECLETKPLVRDERFCQRMQNTIASLFMPIALYNDHIKEFRTDGMYSQWWTFRDELLACAECGYLFALADFRKAIASMNNFISDLDRHDLGRTIEFDFLKGTAEVLVECSPAKGWELIMEGLKIIEPRQRNSELDTQDLKISLQTIHRCVKMYHEAAEPDQE